MSLAEKGRIMRKLSVAVATLLVSTLALTACGSEAGDGDTTSLVVGASPVPHARILEFVRDNLAAEAGIELEIREFDDYVTPNTAVEDGSIDANYFQHVPYFDNFTEEHGYDFERGEGIHIEPFAAFSDQHDSVADVPDGATVAITNDPSNQFRALKVLEAAGLLENVADDATVLTLTDEENTRGLQFEENQPEVIVQLLGDPGHDQRQLHPHRRPLGRGGHRHRRGGRKPLRQRAGLEGRLREDRRHHPARRTAPQRGSGRLHPTGVALG